jgi:hypothetical protein
VTYARITGLLCMALAALPVASTGASAPSTGDEQAVPTIVWTDDEITRIGSLRTTSETSPPTITRAIAAFGRPSSTKRLSRVACRLSWRTLGLRATFVSLGTAFPTKTTCVQRLGVLQTATVNSSGLRTQGGLRVGDSVAQLKQLHPDAYFREGGFWLATAPTVIGSTEESQRTWVVRALASGGIVRRLGLRIQAAAANPPPG